MFESKNYKEKYENARWRDEWFLFVRMKICGRKNIVLNCSIGIGSYKIF